MTYVVVYDIADDHARARVASLLAGYGRRVQESVFECVVDDRTVGELTERLRRALAEAEGGQVLVYRVCGNCLQASFGLGSIEPRDPGQCFIV